MTVETTRSKWIRAPLALALCVSAAGVADSGPSAESVARAAPVDRDKTGTNGGRKLTLVLPDELLPILRADDRSSTERVGFSDRWPSHPAFVW